MASTIEDFEKFVSGSEGSVSEYSPVIASTGDFSYVTGVDAIIQLWSNILMTPTGTYPFDPDFGTIIHNLIFEPMDFPTLSRQIEEEVIGKLTLYENRGEIESVNIKMLTSRKGVRVDILCNFDGIEREFSVPITQLQID